MGAKGSTEKGSTKILLDKQKSNYNSIDMDDRFSYCLVPIPGFKLIVVS